MINTIVVGVDGSANSKKALEFACGIAAKYGASLHLVHFAQPLTSDHALTLGAASVLASGTRADLTKVGRSVVGAAKDLAKSRGCTNVTTEVTFGDPARGIIDSARSLPADMIVLGSRGLGELSGMLLGSVSHKVSHLAPCTCVVVK
jgi:nucleotide-binding universal stress UspA family protein